MKQFRYLCLAWMSMLLMGSCRQSPQHEPTAPETKPQITVRFANAKPKAATVTKETTQEVSTLSSVKGYLFEEGILREVLVGEEQISGETYTFYPTTTQGDIYFVANDTQELLGDLQSGTTTLSELLQTTSETAARTDGPLMMTGTLTLGHDTAAIQTVTLQRTVARLDVVSPDSGVTLHSVTLKGVARQGYLFPQSPLASPDQNQWDEFRKEYPEPGIENLDETLIYLNEQLGAPLTAEVIVSFGGGRHRMVATLPDPIVRNRIYTLRVFGAGAQATVAIDGEEWERGSATDAAPSPKGMIDLEASTLSEGVTVSASRDSLFIPYTGADIQLAICAEAGSDITVEGVVDRVTTAIQRTSTKTLEQVATLALTSGRRMPNEKQQYLYLNTSHQGADAARIVVVFEPHVIRLTGALKLDSTGTCDFGRYIDGELGRITLPDGKRAFVEFEADEDHWVKLEPDGNELRILGGWRPNDPKADGRTQHCRLVFVDANGTDRESYEIRRVNRGLPVVSFGGQWWCKYNLRGNATSFSDQITIAENTIPDDELAEHLTQCSSEELLRLLGDAYQGGYPDGLPLSHNGNAFTFAGMRASAQDFGALDPTAMAPDGYQIPNRAEWSLFGANENHNLGGAGTRSFRNAAGQQVTVQITEHPVTLLGHAYGTLIFYEFTTTDGTFVLCGLGHQWNNTPGNIAPLTLIMATAGQTGKSWNMEGYAQTSTPASQNWWKFSGHNSTKTRIIRCIKTPVEYIY